MHQECYLDASWCTALRSAGVFAWASRDAWRVRGQWESFVSHRTGRCGGRVLRSKRRSRPRYVSFTVLLL